MTDSTTGGAGGSRSRAWALALATTALLLLSQQPVGWSPLAFAALAPFASLAELPRESRPLRAAYGAGLLHFVIGCSWLANTSPANLALMSLAEAFTFPLAVIVQRALRELRLPRFLAVALAFTAVEWLRSCWPFNGFPWLALGWALATPLEFAQFAEWGGTLSLTFAAALSSGLFATAFSLRRVKPVALAVTIAALHVPALLYIHGAKRIGEVRDSLAIGPTVLAVQANIPQELKRGQTAPERIFDEHLSLTAAALGPSGADLVVWPETMFPYALLHRGRVAAERDLIQDLVIARLLAPQRAAFLLGAITVDGERPYRDPTRNAAILYSPQGERVATYAKTILVPGGEFVPLRSVLGFVIDPIVAAIAGFVPSLVPGDGPSEMKVRSPLGEFRFGVTICYENVYAGYAARAARDVDFMVNLSNEAWFKESFEFDQMDAASRLRAIESRRSLVRATNSGISALYSPTGERTDSVRSSSGQDRAVAGVLRAEVMIASERPAFADLGDLLGTGIAALVLSAAAIRILLSRYRRRTPE